MNETTPSSSPPSDAGREPRPHKWPRRLRRIGVALVLLLLLAGVGAVGMEYYTSRPAFCGSCHIMGPYYKSWRKDYHSTDVYAACVDCHYAPGQQHTVMAKFRGMSQLMSYFSGRAGASRPRARVNDASCLTSECHGDRKFMAATLKVGDVEFTHATHLDPDSTALLAKQDELANMRAELAAQLGEDRLAAVESVARSVQRADERELHVVGWLTNHDLLDHRDEVVEYATLLHTEVRIDQLGGLKCASCHQYDASGEHHFAVARTTCYTCHFMNQAFNTDTGRCLNCHEPPAGPIAIHGAAGGTASAPAGAVTMDHATIIANNVSCVACHADLTPGSGVVTRRECEACHDQQRYLQDFDALTTDVVREYHRVHAAGQRARCTDCHHVITHKLKPVADPNNTMALLSPVREDCQHCHPDHHRPQILMILGRGGFLESGAGVPNQMTGSRVNCRGCHTEPDTDATGQAVIRTTLESCRGCHSDDYAELLVSWRESIRARLAEVQELLSQVEQELEASGQPDKPQTAKARKRWERARSNVQFVLVGNGLHNKNYALTLLDQAAVDLEAAQKLLAQ